MKYNSSRFVLLVFLTILTGILGVKLVDWIDNQYLQSVILGAIGTLLTKFDWPKTDNMLRVFIILFVLTLIFLYIIAARKLRNIKVPSDSDTLNDYVSSSFKLLLSIFVSVIVIGLIFKYILFIFLVIR